MQAFPSYRFGGDKDAAAALRLVAQNLLHQARLIDRVSPSRITKLNRSTPQGEVEVLIIEGQEYVFITGVGSGGRIRRRVEPVIFQALSGALRSGFLRNENNESITEYRPTADAYVNVLGSPEIYSPAEFRPAGNLLNQNAVEGSGLTVPIVRSQGSAFSGPMAAMLDLLAGFRNMDVPEGVTAVPDEGVFIEPNFQTSNECTHGIVRLGDAAWLVEISFDRGIIAMRLPLASVRVTSPADYENDTELQIQASDATDECERLFGGIPSGAGFPTAPQAYLDAVENGTIQVVLRPEDLFDYYGQTDNVKNFAWLGNGAERGGIGWSFNASGTEAHNTNGRRVFDLEAGRSRLFAQHWKIVFGGNAESITATLSIVSRDLFIQRDNFVRGLLTIGGDGFGGFSAISGDQPRVSDESGVDIDEASQATFFVAHHGDTLIKCRYESNYVEPTQSHNRNPTPDDPLTLENLTISRVFLEGVTSAAPQQSIYTRLIFEFGVEVEEDATDTYDLGRRAVVWWSPSARDAIAIEGSHNFQSEIRNIRVGESGSFGVGATDLIFEVLAPRSSFIRPQAVDPDFFVRRPSVASPPSPVYRPAPSISTGPTPTSGFAVFIYYSTCGPNAQLVCSGSSRSLSAGFDDFSAEEKSAYGLHATGTLIATESPFSNVLGFCFLGFI